MCDQFWIKLGLSGKAYGLIEIRSDTDINTLSLHRKCQTLSDFLGFFESVSDARDHINQNILLVKIR